MLTRSAAQQIQELSALLRQKRNRVGFLLGAGCPMSVKKDGKDLIPGIEGLTTHVCGELRKECAPELEKLQSLMSEDGLPSTVEAMLTVVRQLRSVCGQSEVRGLSARDLEKLEKNICRAVHGLMTTSLPTRDTPYHDFAWWAGSCARTYPTEVFTTNYDLLMEQALEESGVPYFDGFIGARHAFFNASAVGEDEQPSWLRLWKLHGSVNWRRDDNGVIRTDSTEFDDKKSLVIHPSHLKYDQSRKMPYVALMDQFRRFLLSPSCILVICGYSFGDDHLNDAIADALLSNKSATAFALLFKKADDYAEAIKLAKRVRNTAVLALDGGIIGSREFLWGDPAPAPTGEEPGNTKFQAGNFTVLATEMRAMTLHESRDA